MEHVNHPFRQEQDKNGRGEIDVCGRFIPDKVDEYLTRAFLAVVSLASARYRLS